MTRRTTVRGFGRSVPGRANRDEAGSSGPGRLRSGWWGSLVVAVVVGMVVPVQARVNGELGRRLEDGLAAALLSFAGGLLLLIVFVLVSARLRRALGALRIAVRDEGFPRWYLLAGTFGAVFALAQSTLTLLTGVAVFTVALLSGQAIGGLVVDARGIGGGVRRRPERHRLIGVGVILVAAVISALPGFANTPDPVTVALPAVGASATGFLIGLQQAMNGATSAVSGSPAAATWVNFWGGSLFLVVAWGVKVLLRGPAEHPLPTDWWLYLGGPCGLVFIGFSALLVRRLGVLLLGMALTAGQLVSSLVLDLLVPSGNHAPSVFTVVAAVLAFVAVGITSLRPRDRHPRR